MTLALCITVLLITALLNLRVSRSIFYPAAFLSSWWCLLLICLALAGDLYIPVSPKTLLVFTVGAIAFSLGALAVQCLYTPGRPGSIISLINSRGRRRTITWSFLILIGVFPLYWRLVHELSANSGISNFWIGLRSATSKSSEAFQESFGLYHYALTGSLFLALALFCDSLLTAKRWRLAVLAILIALVYNLLTASRLASLWLIIAVSTMYLTRAPRLQLKSLWLRVRAGVLAGVGLCLVFSLMAVLLNKGGKADSDTTENVTNVGASLRDYVLGGPVALNAVVADGAQVGDLWRTFRFGFAVAHAMGADVKVPSVLSSYAYVPTPHNVYTMYYPYYLDFGWLGVITIPALLGSLATLWYKGALVGHPRSLILHGLMSAYLLLSCADEYVFSLMSINIRLLLFVAVFYSRSFFVMDGRLTVHHHFRPAPLLYPSRVMETAER